MAGEGQRPLWLNGLVVRRQGAVVGRGVDLLVVVDEDAVVPHCDAGGVDESAVLLEDRGVEDKAGQLPVGVLPTWHGLGVPNAEFRVGGPLQPMDHRQDADATKYHGQDARAAKCAQRPHGIALEDHVAGLPPARLASYSESFRTRQRLVWYKYRGQRRGSVHVAPRGVHRQMADQRVRTDDRFPEIASLCRVVVLILLAPPSILSAGETFGDPDAVRMKRIRTPTYVSLVLENRRAYDVTVTLTIRPENAQVTRLVPETTTYGGYAQVEAARISVADPGKPYRWRYNLHWAKGAMHVRHDDETRYRLPFQKGETYRVSQGYEGRWSHRGQDRYAVDFAMPEGTTVCAAREGVVVDLKESSKTGGPDKKYKDEDNYVSIAHADGTIAEYHHLKHDGVLVEIGDAVTVGQAIALSGNTGYSTLPHLHFGVYSAIDGSHRQSHRVTFVAREGIITEPRRRKDLHRRVTSLCWERPWSAHVITRNLTPEPTTCWTVLPLVRYNPGR